MTFVRRALALVLMLALGVFLPMWNMYGKMAAHT